MTAAGDAWLGRTILALSEVASPALDPADLAHQAAIRCEQHRPGTGVAVLVSTGAALPICAGSPAAVRVERAGLQAHEGPAVESLAGGGGPRIAYLDRGDEWPGYVAAAREQGFAVVRSIPIVRTGEPAPLGVLDIFATSATSPPPAEPFARLAYYLGTRLWQDAALRDARLDAAALRSALDSRVLIEQAKGMLAQHAGISTESAYRALRSYARGTNTLLVTLCESVVNRQRDLDTIAVELHTMSPARRLWLREDALTRWRQAMAQALEQRTRAAAARSVSTELSLQIRDRAALRDIELVERSIERRARALAAVPRRGYRPRVLIGSGDSATQSFAAGAIRLDGRLHLVGQAASAAELLGVSIIEQPDVLILDPSLLSRPGRHFTTHLRSLCPDSRTLLVLGRPDDVAPGIHVDTVVPHGDAAALVRRVLQLCGARGRP